MSLWLNLSEGQKRYICGGIDLGLRSDGRSCDDYQLLSCESDVAQHCDGSSHVRCGKNDILVGVKLEIEDVTNTDTDTPHTGRIELFADVTANASPQFEGKHGEDISNELVAIFTSAIPQFIDLKSLVVIENKSIWVLHVDIVILECGSRASLIDTTSLAVKAALYDTKIPKVTINSADSGDFIVSDDVFESRRLDVSQVPIFVTLTKISNNYVVDVTQEEEAASISSVVFAVNDSGVVYIKKIGCGSLHPDPLKNILQKVKQIGINQNKELMKKLSTEPDKKSKGKIHF